MIDTSSMPAHEPSLDEVGDDNARLLSFLYACPAGLLEITSQGEIGMINPLAMQLLMRMHSMPTLNLFEATACHAPELRNMLESYTASQGTVFDNHRILVRNGHVNQAELEVFSCTLVKLGPDRFMVALSDISNQVRQERKLKEAESWLASLLDGSAEFSVASLDAAGAISSISSSFRKQTGFQEKDLLGQSLDFLNAGPGSEGSLTAQEQLALAAREGWHLNEDWQRHQDGSRMWYQRLVAVRHDQEADGAEEEISGYTVVLREGKQRSMDTYKLKQMLTRDHLTGTYNRMHFFEMAERECARKKRYAQPLSVIAADVDFFKRVNDAHGHAMGDKVLKRFAEICLALLRPADVMARIGGEEFAILLPATQLDGARLLAERLRAAVSEARLEVAGVPLGITASFGCSELRETCSLATIMADADAALYTAKQAGRNCVIAKAPVQ